MHKMYPLKIKIERVFNSYVHLKTDLNWKVILISNLN